MAARIPRYTEQQTAGALPGTPRASAPDAFGRFAQDVGAIGRDLAGREYAREEGERRQQVALDRAQQATRIADAQAAEDRQQRVNAHVAFAELVGQTDQMVQDAKDASQGDPRGFAPRINAAVVKAGDDLLTKFPGEVARNYLVSALAEYRVRTAAHSLAWEQTQGARFDRAREKDAAESFTPGVMADDSLYEPRVASLIAQIDAGRGSEAEKEQARDSVRQSLAAAAAVGFAQRNPDAALALTDKRLGLKAAPPKAAAADPWKIDPAVQAQRDRAAADLKRAEGAPADDIALSVRYAEKYEKLAAAGGATVQPYTASVEPTGTPGETGVPWMDALSPQGVMHVRSAALAQKREGVADLQHEVRARAGDAEAAAVHGKVVPTASEAQYVAAYGKDKGPELYRQDQRWPALGAAIASQFGKSPEEIAANRPSEPVAGAAGDVRQGYAIRELYDDAARRTLAAREKDPIQQAGVEGIAKIVPIDWKDASASIAALKERQPVAQAMGRFAPGSPPAAMTNLEAKAFRESWGKLDPKLRSGVLASMKDALSDPRVFAATVQQIAPDSPPVRVAAQIVAKRGQGWTPAGVSAMATAETIIRGDDLLNPSKAAKREDGKPSAFAMPKDFESVFVGQVGDALAANPEAFNEAMQATRAWYAATMADRGKYGKDNADSDVVKEAIAATIGPVIPWRGVGSVILPWGMDAGAGRNRLNEEWVRAMAANGYAGGVYDQPERTRLVAAGEGRYLVAAGSGFLQGKNGPVVLDINPAPWPRGLADQVPR